MVSQNLFSDYNKKKTMKVTLLFQYTNYYKRDFSYIPTFNIEWNKNKHLVLLKKIK